MRRTFASRLEALERRAPGAVEWTIPIAFVDEDGRIVGTVPAAPLPPRNPMGNRDFDYLATVALLTAAMGCEHEAFR